MDAHDAYPHGALTFRRDNRVALRETVLARRYNIKHDLVTRAKLRAISDQRRRRRRRRRKEKNCVVCARRLCFVSKTHCLTAWKQQKKNVLRAVILATLKYDKTALFPLFIQFFFSLFT
jgi:hypothetical protein